MDTHIFQETVPTGELVEDGPRNQARLDLLLPLSVWLNGPHEEYPPTTFSNYLKLRGWDRDKLLNWNWDSANPANAGKSEEEIILSSLSVIQSWLTLGFLESVLGQRIPVDKYTRRITREDFDRMMSNTPERKSMFEKVFEHAFIDDQIRYFHTKHLVSNLVAQQYLMTEQFRIHFGIAKPPNHEEHVSEIAAAHLEMGKALGALNMLKKFHLNITRFLYFILVFPTILIDTTINHVLLPLRGLDNRYPEGFAKLLQVSQLVQRNWCPYTIKKLRITTNYTVVYWLWASGFKGLTSRPHVNCDERQCHAYRYEEGTYKSIHFDGCTGDCGTFYPSLEKLSKILTEGKIPLVVARRNHGHIEFSIDVDEYDRTEQSRSFVAFSHVWADGRGSTTEKGLPYCQCKFLINACTSLPQYNDGDVAFWIDSLCIPEDTALRKRAITQIASVYDSATAVIVLDETIQKCSIRASPEELLMRIYTSPWMDRVWTFQEGALARHLFFKFKDAYCPLRFSLKDMDLTGPLQIGPLESTKHDIYLELRREVQNLNSAIVPINISHVVRELRWRQTSKRADELLAVSIVLKLDVDKVLEAEDEEHRMAKFLILVENLPRDIIFAEVPRLALDGFRWAPSTFLTTDPRRLDGDV